MRLYLTSWSKSLTHCPANPSEKHPLQNLKQNLVSDTLFLYTLFFILSLVSVPMNTCERFRTMSGSLPRYLAIEEKGVSQNLPYGGSSSSFRSCLFQRSQYQETEETCQHWALIPVTLLSFQRTPSLVRDLLVSHKPNQRLFEFSSVKTSVKTV